MDYGRLFMKKINLLLLMMAVLVLPFSVLADKVASDDNAENSQNQEMVIEESEDGKSKEVNVYFFRGDGCPHCAEAEDFFDSIEDEYGDLFEIKDYETWYDSSNAALLEKVAEARGETVSGVPYILIGNKSWSGYSSDFNDEIIEKIKEEYKTSVDERYDIMELIGYDDDESEEEKSYSTDVMILIIILAVSAAVVGGIGFARKKTA